MSPKIALGSKIWQVVSLVKNIIWTLGVHVIVTVYNGCKCRKMAIITSPNRTKIFSPPGLSSKRIPSKVWWHIRAATSIVCVSVIMPFRKMFTDFHLVCVTGKDDEQSWLHLFYVNKDTIHPILYWDLPSHPELQWNYANNNFPDNY